MMKKSRIIYGIPTTKGEIRRVGRGDPKIPEGTYRRLGSQEPEMESWGLDSWWAN